MRVELFNTDNIQKSVEVAVTIAGPQLIGRAYDYGLSEWFDE